MRLWSELKRSLLSPGRAPPQGMPNVVRLEPVESQRDLTLENVALRHLGLVRGRVCNEAFKRIGLINEFENFGLSECAQLCLVWERATRLACRTWAAR